MLRKKDAKQRRYRWYGIKEKKTFSDRKPDRFLNPIPGSIRTPSSGGVEKKIITVFPRVQRTEREVGPMSSAFGAQQLAKSKGFQFVSNTQKRLERREMEKNTEG